VIGTAEANWESVSMYSILRKNFGLMIVPARENNTEKRSDEMRERANGILLVNQLEWTMY
jgi:hypothetical protein